MDTDATILVLLGVIVFQFVWLLKMLRNTQKDWAYFQSKLDKLLGEEIERSRDES